MAIVFKQETFRDDFRTNAVAAKYRNARLHTRCS